MLTIDLKNLCIVGVVKPLIGYNSNFINYRKLFLKITQNRFN